MEGCLRLLLPDAMLSHRLVAATASLWLIASPVGALADSKPPVVTVTGDAVAGAINTSVTSPSSPGSSSHKTQAHRTSTSSVRCTWAEESSYSQQVFQWLGADPKGTWYDVRCSDGSSYVGIYVPPRAANIPTAVVVAGGRAPSAPHP